jgi:hypothetical protein
MSKPRAHDAFEYKNGKLNSHTHLLFAVYILPRSVAAGVSADSLIIPIVTNYTKNLCYYRKAKLNSRVWVIGFLRNID